MNLDMTMFHQAFFEEAGDLLGDLEHLLLRLEETPDDPEVLATIFRCAHSIKGGSATFGFADIAKFTHSMETLLDRLRNGQLSVDADLVKLLLESADQLRMLLDVARGESAEAPDSSPLIARMEAVLNGAAAPAAPAASEAPAAAATEAVPTDGTRRYTLRFVPGLDVLRQGTDPMLLLGKLAEAGTIRNIDCDTQRLPALTEMDPEASYLGWTVDFDSAWPQSDILDIFEFVADESEIELTEEPVQAPAPAAPAAPAPTATAGKPAAAPKAAAPAAPAAAAKTGGASAPKGDAHTLRVATDKVDKLINLVGELVINQSMLNEIVQNFGMEKVGRLIEAVAAMERASRELQERVMAIRMLPIKHAFGRFPRMVHDLASSCGKRVDLKMSGEETELDKTVIEAIADPLTHLVRNSVDHGLEKPDERVAAGKPEVGTVHLHAYHEGGNIVVEVTDDGRGLNRDRILAKAIERGLLAEGEPAPSDDVIYNYIFHPGFSTAAKVTDVSGRGVGMDIVKKGVQALGGSIGLTSTPGMGTRFRIRLPLTLAILEGQSLSVGDEVYIVPLANIVESMRPRPEDVRVMAGHDEVVMVRGEVLPILRLYQQFGAEARITNPTEGLLVIVENESHKLAMLADELIGQGQVVIKSLETNYRKVDGIAGATILGDGRVALILDIPGLIRCSEATQHSYAAA